MKILFIGCGSIGKRHIKNLISLRRACRILAFDTDKGRLREAERIAPSLVTSRRLGDLWKMKPDAAFITAPTALHVKYATKAANRGCHLFIEKPVSHNTEGLKDLITITKKKKLVTFIGYNYRFNTCALKIKELLKNNAIGRVVSARAHFGSYLPARHPWENYRTGYGAKKSLGGGVVLDALSHYLDLLIFLFGKPESVLNYAGRLSKLKIEVEDTSEGIIKFPKGPVVSVHGNFIQRPYRSGLELIGDKGTIYCDFVKRSVKCYSARKNEWAIYKGDRDYNTAYVREIKRFLDCVSKKASVPVDAKAGAGEIEIMMKMKKSSACNKWIKV